VFFSLLIVSLLSSGIALDTPPDFNILIVDDFPSAAFNWKPLWENPLKSSGVSFEITPAEQVRKPDNTGYVRLQDYDAIIWNTGTEEKDTLTELERAAIGAYLEEGGKVMITGTGIAYELAKTGKRHWLNRYLRTAYLMPNSPIVKGSIYEHESLVGCKGSIFEGVNFEIDHGQFDTYPAHNLNLIYETVDSAAGGGGAIHCVEFKDIAGNLGIQFEGAILPCAPQCKLIFLTFPIETVHPAEIRNQMIQRALEFFISSEKPRYELRGVVSTNTKSPIPLEDAVVKIKGTTIRTLTRSDGSFVLTGVPQGQHDLEVTLFRYQPACVEKVEVPRPLQAPLKITLDPTERPLVEGRGIWVIRDQMTSPEKIKKVVEDCAAGGFNAIFAQVRGRGDAYYFSATEPRAQALANQPEDFDPLAYIIQLAHEKNIELHAWMNACYAYEGRNARNPYSPKHVIAGHPEWVLTNRAGKSLLDYTPQEIREHHVEGVYLSPCIPECRKYLADVYLEVVEKYDVDGVHFDFIRFPFAGESFDDEWALGFSPLSRQAFKNEHGVDPLEIDPKDREKVKLFNDWRRLCVSRLVEDVTTRAHKVKPGIRVSAAVLERYHLARASHCYQDWLEWLKNGKIDTCCIMAYNTDNPLVMQRIRMAVENQGKGTVWAGLSANWRGDRTPGSFEYIMERVEMVRRVNPKGIMFFAYKHFNDEELEALRNHVFESPTVVPKTDR